MRYKRLLGKLKVPHGGSVGGALATYNFTGTGWATFGLALPQGSATGGVKVGSLTTQTDVLRTWGDGSIRRALVTANISGTGTQDITADSQTAGSITPTWPTASVTAVSGGVTYTATLPSFTAADSYVSGPHLRECKVITVFTGGSGTNAANYLQCWWYVRSYSDSTHQISVMLVNGDVESANANRVVMSSLTVTISGSTVYSDTETVGTNTLSSAGPVITSTAHGLIPNDTIQLTSGPQSGETAFIVTGGDANSVYSYYSGGLFANESFSVNQTNQSWKRVPTIWWGSRRILRFNVGGFTEATYLPDFTPFYNSYALVQFGTGLATETYTDTGRLYDPGGLGDTDIPIYASTGDFQLGIYPHWVAVWQEHLTSNQWDHMILMADRLATLPSAMVIRANGTLVRATDSGWDQYLIHNNRVGNSIAGNGLAGAGWGYEWEPAHGGSHQYVPYTLTGRREYLDCQKQTASSFLFEGAPGTFDSTFTNHPSNGRGIDFLGVSGNGARGYGWRLRTWADLAACIPDADTDKSYVIGVVTNNATYAESYAAAAASDTDNIFSFVGTDVDQYFGSPDGATGATVSFLFQTYYMGIGIHRVKQHGFMSTSALRNMVGKSELLRVQSDPTFPRSWGQPYEIALARQTTAPITSITTGTTPTITTRGAHALHTGNSVTLTSTNSTPSVDGFYPVTVTGIKTFTITGVNVTGAGTSGSITNMPCNSIAHGNAFQYYWDWAQVFESTQHLDFMGGFTGPVFPTQQFAQHSYGMVQWAVEAGEPGAAAALAYLATFDNATSGPFSMARL